MPKLTKRTIEKIAAPPAAKGSRDVPDALVPGLYLSVKPSGVKSWCVRYRFEGRQRRYTVGRLEKFDVGQARRKAQAVLRQVEEGIDPQTEKLAVRSGDIKDAFPEMAVRFIEQYALPNKNRSWLSQARVLGLRLGPQARRNPALERHWGIIPGSPADRWQKRTVGSITRREVAELIGDTVSSSGPAAAIKLRATLSRLFGWMIEQGVIEQSPVVGTKAPSPNNSRSRTLDAVELSLVWRATDALGTPFQQLIRLLILLGQRRDETAGMSRHRLTGNIWTLPAEGVGRTKNKLEHEVPLPKAALDIIATLPRSPSGLLLTTNDKTPISGYSKMKAALDAEITRLNGGRSIAPWALHDLRRTCRTGLAALGVPPHVAEHVLNHVSGARAGVVAVYDKHPYRAEKRRALERWAEHVLVAVEALG